MTRITFNLRSRVQISAEAAEVLAGWLGTMRKTFLP